MVNRNEIKTIENQNAKLETRLKSEQERLKNEISIREEKEDLLSQQVKNVEQTKQDNVQLRSQINTMRNEMQDFEKQNVSNLQIIKDKK